jgi:AsmA protein
MRKLVIALGVIVVLLAIAAGVILHSFDAERVRGIISADLQNALGRKVTLGDLRLGLFPPSLYVQDAQIAEALGFKDPVFSSAQTFKMRVRLLPLLHNRVEVPSIELVQPVIHLVKNAKGEWNFASLGTTGTAAATPARSGAGESAETGRVLQIEELQLRDGTVTVDDLQKNTPQITLDHISLTVKNFTPDQPFDWKVSVHPPGPGTSEVRANGRGGPLGKQNLAASPVDGHVVFRDVALESLAPFTGQPGLAGAFEGDADFKSDGSKAEAKGTYKIVRLRLNAMGGTAGAPLSGRFDVSMPEDASRLLVNQFDLISGKAVAHSTGELRFGAHPETDLRANLPAAPLVDVAKLFPLFGITLPAGSSLTEGTLGGELRAFGPSEALKESGKIDIRNARLSGYSVAGQMGAALKLMAVDTGGRDTAIERLEMAFEADPAYTHISSFSVAIPGMEITGTGGFTQAEAIDFRGDATLTRGGSSSIGGLLQKATGGAASVPFTVAGTLENPAFRPDVGKVVNQQMAEQLNKQLNKQLGKQPGLQNPGAEQLFRGLGGMFGKKK